MNKIKKLHHSVTELGTIQVRQITEYVKDGRVIDKKYGEPMTPADTSKMDGWDDKSKDIVTAITDKVALAEFAIEKKEPTGTGLEEIVTYDRTLDDLGRISVRRITRIFDEGEEVSKKYHRSWIMPGDDPKDADVMSKAVAAKLHTPEAVSAYTVSQDEKEITL